MRIAPSGQDIRFDEKQIEEGRNFATKLWNAARFRQMHGPSERKPELKGEQLSIYAIEVLARLNDTIDAVEGAYREYQFNTSRSTAIRFLFGAIFATGSSKRRRPIFSARTRRGNNRPWRRWILFFLPLFGCFIHSCRT